MIDDNFKKQLLHRGNIRYSLYESPVGFLYLLGTDSLLNAVLFKDHRAKDARIESLFTKGTPAQVKTAARFLDAYFGSGVSGSRRTSGLKSSTKDSIITVMFNGQACRLDLSDFTAKEIAVYSELLKVASGRTVSYLELSERAGIPSGARFVGNAMARNAFPIIIPCHRVIKSGGAIGNYGGGVGIKVFLLGHEGYEF